MKATFYKALRHGGDTEAEQAYRWHIAQRSGHRMALGMPTDGWKRTTDHYVLSAIVLYNSMRAKGFDPQYPVPIDPNGELLGGAHRVACALALGIETVPVDRKPTFAWAPPWDRQWFADHGMSPAELDALDRAYTALKGDHHGRERPNDPLRWLEEKGLQA